MVFIVILNSGHAAFIFITKNESNTKNVKKGLLHHLVPTYFGLNTFWLIQLNTLYTRKLKRKVTTSIDFFYFDQLKYIKMLRPNQGTSKRWNDYKTPFTMITSLEASCKHSILIGSEQALALRRQYFPCTGEICLSRPIQPFKLLPGKIGSVIITLWTKYTEAKYVGTKL